MKYLKKFNTLGSAITWDRTGNNSRVSPITYFIEESGQVLYREYVNMTPNDHDFVDLGLPSGTLWATMNIGASDPNQAGSYFAWGEIETKNSYTPETYSYHLEDYPYYTKYNDDDSKIVLDEEDDVAHVLWGGGWHIPTKDQFSELINNTTISVEVTNGVSGWKFESGNGSYIFLPLGTGSYSGNYKYWTSTVSPYTSSGAKQSSWALRNTDSPSSPSSPTSSLNLIERYGGGWIRPVIEPGRFWYNKPIIHK